MPPRPVASPSALKRPPGRGSVIIKRNAAEPRDVLCYYRRLCCARRRQTLRSKAVVNFRTLQSDYKILRYQTLIILNCGTFVGCYYEPDAKIDYFHSTSKCRQKTRHIPAKSILPILRNPIPWDFRLNYRLWNITCLQVNPQLDNHNSLNN